MAEYWVYSAGGGDGSGSDKANPYPSLQEAFEGPSPMVLDNGDVINVDYRHIEDTGAQISINMMNDKTLYKNGKAGIELRCVDFDQDPVTRQKMTSAGLGSTGGNFYFDLTQTGTNTWPTLKALWDSLKFNGSSDRMLRFNGPSVHHFRNCDFVFGSTVRNTTNSPFNRHFYEKCDFDFQSNNSIEVIRDAGNSNYFEVGMNECTFSGISGSQSNAIFRLGGNTNPASRGFFTLENMDLSGLNQLISTTISAGNPGTICDLIVRGCKLPSGEPTLAFLGGLDCLTSHDIKARFVECYDGELTLRAPLIHALVANTGFVRRTTGIYYTALPATDFENAVSYSWQIEPTTECTYGRPIECLDFVGNHEGGGKTLTIRIARNAATFDDEKVWVDVVWPGAGSGQEVVRQRLSTRAFPGEAQAPDASPYLKTDTDGSWTGGGGTLNEFKLVVPVPSDIPGTLRAKVFVADVSGAFGYVSPVVELS